MTEINHRYSEEELVALLPFYLSDTLSAHERRLVDDWLARDAAAPALLDKIAEERHATALANEEIRAPRGGLEKLMAEIAVTPQEVTASGLGARFGRWLDASVVAPLRAAPSSLAWAACALLMAVTISQSVLLYKAETGGQTGEGIVLAGGEQAAVLASALVQFTEAAKMSEVSALLDEAGAVILAGPTASGQFTIGFLKEEGERALEARQKLISSAEALVSLYILTDGGPSAD